MSLSIDWRNARRVQVRLTPSVRLYGRRFLLLALIVESIALLILGQLSISNRYLTNLWFGTWLVGLTVIVFLDYRLTNSTDKATRNVATSRAVFLSWRRWSVLGLTVPLAHYVWTESRYRPSAEDHLDLVIAWILLMGLAWAVVAWPVRPPRRSELALWLHTNWREFVVVLTITGAALLLRVTKLEQYPWVFSGDEGKFALTSRAVLEGRLRNPFETTFDAQVSAWLFLQAGVMAIFGDDIRGARMLGALMGTATVPLFYLLIRRQFGRGAAAVSAILLTFFHFHVFTSRDALNNISSPFFLVLSLLLLDQLVSSWSASKAVQLGLVIGLSQYAYLSNRLLVPIALTIIILTLVLHRPRLGTEWLATAQCILLGAIGFVLAILPLAAYFIDHPENLNARFNAVSVFASGWIDQRKALTGQSETEILWNQFETAALLPFHSETAGNYIINAPFIGWPLVVAGSIGVAVLTANALRRQYLALAVTYWAVVVGVSLTIGTPETNRFAMGALLLPLIAAIGIVTVARLLRRYAGVPQSAMLFGLTALLALTAFWNVRVAFNRDPSVNRKPTQNTVAVNEFARDLENWGPGYAIYFAGAPSVFYDGLPNVQFRAPGNEAIDVLEPWTEADRPPLITQPTIFFFLPERRDELAIVQVWFPGGKVEDQYSNRVVDEPDHTLIYTTYTVLPPLGPTFLP